MATIRVSKVDAARRQLDSAIRLWFAEGDPVTIHALAWAAYQIVQDINEKRGEVSMSLVEIMRKIVRPEHLEDAMQHFKRPMAFFKHARRDPYEVLEFNPAESETIFLFAIRSLELLGEQRTDVQSVFYFWANLHSPDYFEQDEKMAQTTPEQLALMRMTRRQDFLGAALLGLTQAKSRRA